MVSDDGAKYCIAIVFVTIPTVVSNYSYRSSQRIEMPNWNYDLIGRDKINIFIKETTNNQLVDPPQTCYTTILCFPPSSVSFQQKNVKKKIPFLSCSRIVSKWKIARSPQNNHGNDKRITYNVRVVKPENAFSPV